MAVRPPTRCSRCKQLHPDIGMCPACRRAGDRDRGTSTQRGYSGLHRSRFRAGVLTADPICVLCHTRPATVADHYPLSRRELVAAGLDPDDPVHGRGLCSRCDRTQTAQRQPGGWNRR